MNQSQQLIVETFQKGYRVVNGEVISPSGKTLATRLDTKGYLSFGRKIDRLRVRPVSVHRLLAYQKFGDKIFQPGIEVRHLDSICINNLDDNIDIGTPSQNSQDKPKHLRTKAALHAASFIKKYDHEEIIKRRSQGATYKQIMNEFGIPSKGTVSFITNHSHLVTNN